MFFSLLKKNSVNHSRLVKSVRTQTYIGLDPYYLAT